MLANIMFYCVRLISSQVAASKLAKQYINPIISPFF